MFEKTVSYFIETAHPVIYKTLNLNVGKKMNTTNLKVRAKRFLHHLHAIYATGVMFRQTNLFYSNMKKARLSFSEKVKLRGVKSKTSVFPNCICISLSP